MYVCMYTVPDLKVGQKKNFSVTPVFLSVDLFVILALHNFLAVD